MAWLPIAGVVPQFAKNAGGASASGYYLKFYAEGTTTAISMATDASGGTTLVKAKLNTRGEPLSNPNDDSSVFVPFLNQNYKAALFLTEADADANNTASALWVVDGLGLNDYLSTGGGFAFQGGTVLVFASLDALKAGTLADGNAASYATLIPNDSAQLTAKTQGFYAGSLDGAGEYILCTLARYRTLIGDVAWVPNGYEAHYLDGGSTHVAVLRTNGSVDILQLGAVTGQDISTVINNCDSADLVVRGSFLCGVVTKSPLKLTLDDASINPPLSTTVEMFSNVSDLQLYGSGRFGGTTPWASYFYRVQTGTNLNRLVVKGQFEFLCSDTTTCVFWCDPGVTSTGGPYVEFEGFEMTGFTRSGIELAMDAESDDAVFIVDNVRSHTGKGRCIQFGNNSYRCNNVTIKNCPRLGDVTSSGSAEAKGILVYGRNVAIDNNHIFRVRNGSTSGGEGLYIKSSFASITNNVLVDAGSSSDGCLCLKGASYFTDTYADEGEWTTVIGNKIVMTDTTLDAKGIGCHDSNVIVAHNELLDLRSNRGSLTYSQAISIGGSEIVSNVLCYSNIVNGWGHFCGNYADSSKGRCFFGDHIKIKNNIVTNLAAGGYGVVWDARCRVAPACQFDSATKTITITGGLSQNSEFNPMAYPVGQTVTISGTVSNNGTFTIAAVSRFVLTVVEALTNETVTPTIVRDKVYGLEICGNTFQSSGTVIRSFAGTVDSLKIDDNTYIGSAYAYRFDSGSIRELFIGAGETYIGVTDIDYATPAPTGAFYRGVKLKTATGSAVTLRAFETDYTINYP